MTPCPSEGAAGNHCSGAHSPPPRYRNCESLLERSHRLWDVPALGDPSRNRSFVALHSETYHVEDCEDFSASELSSSLPLYAAFNLSLPRSSPLAACRQCPQPCSLCRGAAPGQSCLSAVLPTCHEVPLSQEPSPAQQQRTNPRQHFLCLLWAPSRCPWGSTVKQTEASTDVSYQRQSWA